MIMTQKRDKHISNSGKFEEKLCDGNHEIYTWRARKGVSQHSKIHILNKLSKCRPSKTTFNHHVCIYIYEIILKFEMESNHLLCFLICSNHDEDQSNPLNENIDQTMKPRTHKVWPKPFLNYLWWISLMSLASDLLFSKSYILYDGNI